MAEDMFGKVILWGCVIFTVFLIGVVILDVTEHQKLMKQCLDDGYKEYECNAILSRCSSRVAPIVIM